MIASFGDANVVKQLASWQENHARRGSMSSNMAFLKNNERNL
ncbi:MULTISPECIES: hypothetical protein [Bacillaceae]|nr:MULTISPECIES: hypothetical protein [Bacillaceae]SHR23926.1 Uncharacterised protein [Mycobacteroides abscessus subsp. abscessus]